MNSAVRPLDDTRMRRLLGYCLAQAGAAAFGVFEAHIGEPFALRRIDYTVLVLVDANPDATNRQLAALLGLSMPYLTVTLDKLVARGLVTRARSDVDRRSSLLRLSDEGRALLREADEAASTMESKLLSRLSAAESAMLFELLNKLRSPRHAHAIAARGAEHGGG
jgi:DNA-binding MarR family transcriptional regulator